MATFQRINENVFKLAEDDIPHEEIASMWQEDERGEYIQINDKYGTWYVAHGKAIEQIAPPDTGDYKFRLINVWMKNKGFYPNIWYVNERGNVELVSRNGKFLGGLV
jgi:hypothetical protein